MKKRTGEPWITAADYGRLLPSFSVNLLVRDVARSIEFYRDVLAAFVHYSDPDFAAIKLAGVDLMLHADHTYEDHPWYAQLAGMNRRGLGAELRLLGMDPNAAESRAQAAGSRIVRTTTERGHGWREVMVEDPDGYVWAVGVLADQR
jgi:uncharacterized glyoxalase superfamily protein PhnB